MDGPAAMFMLLADIVHPGNLSKPQLESVLALARKELTMSLLSSLKDFNVAIVGGGMCGLAW